MGEHLQVSNQTKMEDKWEGLLRRLLWTVLLMIRTRAQAWFMPSLDLAEANLLFANLSLNYCETFLSSFPCFTRRIVELEWFTQIEALRCLRWCEISLPGATQEPSEVCTPLQGWVGFWSCLVYPRGWVHQVASYASPLPFWLRFLSPVKHIRDYKCSSQLPCTGICTRAERLKVDGAQARQWHNTLYGSKWTKKYWVFCQTFWKLCAQHMCSERCLINYQRGGKISHRLKG